MPDTIIYKPAIFSLTEIPERGVALAMNFYQTAQTNHAKKTIGGSKWEQQILSGIAKRLKIPKLHSLVATLHLKPNNKSGQKTWYELQGHFSAHVTLTCCLSHASFNHQLSGEIETALIAAVHYQPDRHADFEIITDKTIDLLEQLVQELSIQLPDFPKSPNLIGQDSGMGSIISSEMGANLSSALSPLVTKVKHKPFANLAKILTEKNSITKKS